MEQVREWMQKNAVISSILCEIAVLGLMRLVGLVLDKILEACGVGIPYEYVSMFLTEFPAALLSLGCLLLVGHQYIFTRKKTNFFLGLITGGYFLVASCFSLVSGMAKFFYTQMGNALGVEYNAENLVAFQSALTEATSSTEGTVALLKHMDLTMNPWFEILAFVATMALVGITEEFLFRGVISEFMLRKFGKTRKGVWLAVVLSGILFGCAHLINLTHSQPVGVLTQVCITSFMGMAFVSIYYRTGNIWLVVFLHAFVDFSALLAGGLFEAANGLTSTISSYSPIMLVGIIPYLIVVLVLLRKKKMATIPEKMQLGWELE